MRHPILITTLTILLTQTACGIDPATKARLDAIEARAEEQVDLSLQELKERLCKLPMDIQERNLDTLEEVFAAYLFCPQTREFYHRMEDALEKYGVPGGIGDDSNEPQ